MGKLILILLLVAAIVVVFYGRTSQQPGQPISGSPTNLTPNRMSSPTPAPALPLQTRVEQVCGRDRVQLISYKESPGNILEITVRGATLQDVQQVLDDLQLAGIMQDLFSDATRYTQIFVTNKFVHEAYFKIRTK